MSAYTTEQGKINKGWECALCDTYALGVGSADKLINHFKIVHKWAFDRGQLHIVAIRWNHSIPEGTCLR